MTATPDLILQMQRMGDLIMTFPLMARLLRQEPERPLWVAAEPQFFKGLMPLAPKAVFFPPEAETSFRQARFRKIINLSHRPEAARMAGQLECEEKIGFFDDGPSRRINGPWQIYRASIVRNNRYNRMHWADLNRMDIFPAGDQALGWALPRSGTAREGHVGLFLGASEPEKRPSAQFWGHLARQLLRKGFKPFLFGGPQDGDLGRAVEEAAGLRGINLCARFDLPGLASALSTLELLISPDTGPMHLAAWVGVPVLNLSMGNVHAFETAPASKGHYVLLPTMSCYGCWLCGRADITCHQAFHPGRVALTAETLLRRPASLPELRLPGLALMETGRDDRGLFTLTRRDAGAQQSSIRRFLAAFWHEWFLEALAERGARDGAETSSRAKAAAEDFAAAAPRLFTLFKASVATLGREMAVYMRSGPYLPSEFWAAHPPLLRPLTGYLPLLLENGDHDATSRRASLDMLAYLAASLEW